MDDKPAQDELGKTKGAMMWRGVRYLSCIGVGYLLGVFAGSAAPDGPGLFIVAAVGLLALFLVFRKGQQANAHAAVDAVLQAHASARAAAAAVATQQVNIAGGHLVQAPGVDHRLDADLRRRIEAAHAEQTYLTPAESPPVTSYERDVWADSREADSIPLDEWDRR